MNANADTSSCPRKRASSLDSCLRRNDLLSVFLPLLNAASLVLSACTGPYADRIRPDAPGSPHVTPSGQALLLSWTDRSETEDAFVIERRAGKQEYTRIAEVPPNQTQFTDDSDLDASEEYTYRILARNGSIHSAPSSPASLCRPDVDEDGFPGRGPRVSLRGECPLTGRPIDCNDSDPDAGGEMPFYPDSDGDGQGVESNAQPSCDRPAGFAPESGDCNDLDAAVYSGAPEICDLKDNDCDPQEGGSAAGGQEPGAADGRVDEGLLCFPGSPPSLSVSANAGHSMRPRITLDEQGRPVVTWEDNTSGNYEIYVKRWDDLSRQWREMGPTSASSGGVSRTPTGSRSPRWAATTGAPIIVWEEWITATPDPLAVRWDEATQQWSGIGDLDSIAQAPVPLVIAESDDSAGNYEIHVRLRTGTGWEDLGSRVQGGASKTAGQSLSPSAAVDSQGTPWVAWEEITDSKSEIYLRRWDAASREWLPSADKASLGRLVPSKSGTDMYPNLVLDRRDRPLLAWQGEFEGAFEVFVAGPAIETAEPVSEQTGR